MQNLITIQRIYPEDWVEYKTIRLEALKSDPEAFKDTYEDALSYSEEKWKVNLTNRNPIVLVAKKFNQIIGMIGSYEESNAISIIWGVYLNKNFRGHGIGKRMLRSIIDYIKKESKTNTIKLWVVDGQKAAFELYKKEGFAIAGREDNQKSIMELKIK